MDKLIRVDHEYINQHVRKIAVLEGVDEAEILRRIANVTAQHERAIVSMKRDMAEMLSTPDDEEDDGLN